MGQHIIRIPVLQSSKIVTTMYVLMGLICTLIGIPMLILGNTEVRIIGRIYLFMPVFMGIFGFIFFVIFAAIYYFAARHLGGFEVEVRDVDHGA